jgi:hypothetical protein
MSDISPSISLHRHASKNISTFRFLLNMFALSVNLLPAPPFPPFFVETMVLFRSSPSFQYI